MSGRELRRARVAMGFSQEELAELLGVEVKLLAGWEHDHTPLPRLAAEVLRMVRQPALF